MKRLSRRDFFKATAALMAGAMIPAPPLGASPTQSEEIDLSGVLGRPFQRAVDLTHVIT
jgi:hypothetical protein